MSCASPPLQGPGHRRVQRIGKTFLFGVWSSECCPLDPGASSPAQLVPSCHGASGTCLSQAPPASCVTRREADKVRVLRPRLGALPSEALGVTVRFLGCAVRALLWVGVRSAEDVPSGETDHRLPVQTRVSVRWCCGEKEAATGAAACGAAATVPGRAAHPPPVAGRAVCRGFRKSQGSRDLGSSVREGRPAVFRDRSHLDASLLFRQQVLAVEAVMSARSRGQLTDRSG